MKNGDAGHHVSSPTTDSRTPGIEVRLCGGGQRAERASEYIQGKETLVRVNDDDPRDRELSAGLSYLHGRINATAGRTLEAASFVYALIEILAEKGLLKIAEVEERKTSVAGRLLKKFMMHDEGVALQESGHDKYEVKNTVAIDCRDHVHLCRALCCKMVFPLSQQDVEEGVIRWDLSKPYIIAKGSDGYCRHLDRTRMGCTVHGCRPFPCRAYDCRKDSRIWLDFEAGAVNPKIHDLDWPHNLTHEERSFGKAQ
jgi:Fe-S-cluster containining protein